MLRRALRPVAAAALRVIATRTVSSAAVTRSAASKLRRPLAWTAGAGTSAFVLYAAAVRQDEWHNNKLIEAAAAEVHRSSLDARTFYASHRNTSWKFTATPKEDTGETSQETDVTLAPTAKPVPHPRELHELVRKGGLRDTAFINAFSLIERFGSVLHASARYFALKRACDESSSRIRRSVRGVLRWIGLLPHFPRDDEHRQIYMIALGVWKEYGCAMAWRHSHMVSGSIALYEEIAAQWDDDPKAVNGFEEYWAMCVLAAVGILDAVEVYIETRDEEHKSFDTGGYGEEMFDLIRNGIEDAEIRLAIDDVSQRVLDARR